MKVFNRHEEPEKGCGLLMAVVAILIIGLCVSLAFGLPEISKWLQTLWLQTL